MKLTREQGKLIAEKDIHIGNIVQEVDGFVYYEPNLPLKLYTSYDLRMIADFLDKENKEIEDLIKNNIK